MLRRLTTVSRKCSNFLQPTEERKFASTTSLSLLEHLHQYHQNLAALKANQARLASLSLQRLKVERRSDYIK